MTLQRGFLKLDRRGARNHERMGGVHSWAKVSVQ